ncbi:hypothetical protein BCR44DRAFT_92010 [Catenaria anguillulae PL171]|uniref:Uncharacterized protein n=1 Tax=Catenaria anguillulae PL171 TaxID=765915 RepID=A0A1Y2HV27_9FUNG|nr:hypothetical protein BCR44DRAFT_92010 [Catenaria anguillulae PL171]
MYISAVGTPTTTSCAFACVVACNDDNQNIGARGKVSISQMLSKKWQNRWWYPRDLFFQRPTKIALPAKAEVEHAQWVVASDAPAGEQMEQAFKHQGQYSLGIAMLKATQATIDSILGMEATFLTTPPHDFGIEFPDQQFDWSVLYQHYLASHVSLLHTTGKFSISTSSASLAHAPAKLAHRFP